MPGSLNKDQIIEDFEIAKEKLERNLFEVSVRTEHRENEVMKLSEDNKKLVSIVDELKTTEKTSVSASHSELEIAQRTVETLRIKNRQQKRKIENSVMKSEKEKQAPRWAADDGEREKGKDAKKQCIGKLRRKRRKKKWRKIKKGHDCLKCFKKVKRIERFRRHRWLHFGIHPSSAIDKMKNGPWSNQMSGMAVWEI